MRVLLRIGLCCLFAGSLMAQRHGGGIGGGVRGGGFGGGFRGGNIGGGIRGGGGFIGGFRGGFGGYRGYYGGFGLGFGFGYGYPYYGYGYDYPGYYGNPYASSYPVYEYNTSPNVTVIYPAQQQAPVPVYGSPAQQAMPSYDQYGQEVRPASPATVAQTAPNPSPIYLIATKDQTIRAASSYWVDGSTLHYTTLQQEQKQLPMDTVDRPLSLQLNRERRVPFTLPQ